MTTVAGIDLAGAPPYGAKRFGVTGLAAVRLAGSRWTALEAAAARWDDDAILAFVRRYDAGVVAIDAPLSLPRGRCCADPACACARFGIVRDADRELLRRGHRPYWTLLPSMVPITLRGIALRGALEAEGREVVEVFPGAVRDALSLHRSDDAGLARELRRAGLRRIAGELPRDALDALAAAWVAALYVRGQCEAVGLPDEGQVWLPRAAIAAGAARRRRARSGRRRWPRASRA